VAKPFLNTLRGGDSAHGALKACGLLGREATTSFISLQLQLPGFLAGPSNSDYSCFSHSCRKKNVLYLLLGTEIAMNVLKEQET